MHFSRKKPEEETILLTPFVDIVLNLLIFFAVTSQFDIASRGPASGFLWCPKSLPAR